MIGLIDIQNCITDLIYEKYPTYDIFTNVRKGQDHEENLNIADELGKIFNLNLNVKDRFLYISNLSFVENDFLQVNFTLKFTDSNDIMEDSPGMDNMEFNLERK